MNEGAILAGIRDIPRICICEWKLDRHLMRWILTVRYGTCPWHGASR